MVDRDLCKGRQLGRKDTTTVFINEKNLDGMMQDRTLSIFCPLFIIPYSDIPSFHEGGA